MDTIRKILLGLLVFLILILIELIKPLRAEEPKPIFHIGAYLGYNLNSHYSSFNRLSSEYFNCCPKFQTASGSGMSFGALFEMPIQERLYWGLRVGYSDFSANFSPREIIGNTELRETVPPFETILITQAEVEHKLESKLQNIGLEPYIGFNAYKALHTIAGLRMSYMMSPEFTQYEKLIRPDNVTFTNGQRIRNEFTDQEIPNHNKLQIHGLLGLGYDLKIGRNSYLTPELKFYIPFMNVSDVDWKATSFQFSAALKIPIYPPEPVAFQDTIITRDTSTIVEAGISTEFVRLKNTRTRQSIVRTDAGKVDRTEITENYERVVPQKDDLALDFKVFGVAANGEYQENPLVIIEEIETEEGFPLLPYIFFPKESNNLRNTRMQLLSSEQTKQFKEEELSWNTMDIYSQMLNVIGKRLTDNPNATIVITGTNNNTEAERNNLTLSQSRAGAVRNYLVDVWGISPSRIRTDAINLPTKPTNPNIIEGIEENSRVEISTTNQSLLAPVYLSEVLRESNPPLIEIHPVIQTSAGLEEYSMKIMQGDTELRRYRQAGGIPAKYDWNIEHSPIPMLETPATISITISDKVGQTLTKEKEVSISQKTIKTKRMQIEGDFRVERYSLILFDFDKSDILANHRDVLDYIKTKITPESIVSVTGYADRTGSSEYNRELARRRSEEAIKYFNLPQRNFLINPVGSDELIFNNGTPEGRSYSRTVRIEIRTPVGGS